jgi:hypothetical protein
MVSLVAEKKRLPVLRAPASGGGEDDAEERPGWQWVGFGTVGIFVVWLPLAFAAQWLSRGALAGYLSESPEATQAKLANLPRGEWARVVAWMVVPHVTSLAIAAWAGGYLVGRYGPKLGPREAAITGVAAGLVAVMLALGNGFSPALLIVPLVAALFAAWGGHVGRKRQTYA